VFDRRGTGTTLVAACGVALAIGLVLVRGESLPGSVSSSQSKMRGVCWEGTAKVDGEALDPLRALGADWISQTPFGWSPSLSAPAVGSFTGRSHAFRGLWGESDEGLAETARLARARRIKTLLKPHLWVRGGVWAGEIEMKSEEDWRAWFASYEAFVLHYARLAEAERMEGLAVGTELPKASRRTEDWRRLIARVRAVYHGPLTYCANWHEAEDVAFWGDLDFIGVQAYYPLTKSERPTPEEIRAAWKPIVARLASLSERTGKRIVFTEVGYKSLSASLAEPWKWDTQGEVDLDLQRDAYRAMFESVWAEPWFGGTFLWKWHPSLGRGTPAWRPWRAQRVDRDFTPQGKPALEVVRQFYTRP